MPVPDNDNMTQLDHWTLTCPKAQQEDKIDLYAMVMSSLVTETSGRVCFFPQRKKKKKTSNHKPSFKAGRRGHDALPPYWKRGACVYMCYNGTLCSTERNVTVLPARPSVIAAG